ncbi:MAG: outer membrane lipoprotein LolB [Candidatus Baumannia cicadellinicola]|nr:outer membrane lipoprotein LolB [Candidatus Baumannia cicadellinicola]MCJ7462277.1 lipoprotein insertase outer membrane protein LolB [Candidatus Baumannia cicadellinicola]MCJ7462664.1 lipoprotein insertase outer membrane protein LolB [Candidatus Baumannia cicadellinicola]
MLASCSINTPNPSNIALMQLTRENNYNLKWHSHKYLVKKINHYRTNGLFAYLSRNKITYANFNWQQISTNHYRLVLLNMIGNAKIDLHILPGLVKLIDFQGQSYLNEEALARIKILLGLDLPLNELHEWILGLPGQATNLTFNQQGYLHKISYHYHGQHWNITYKSYHEDKIPALPDCIEIRQDNNLIKLKMNEWSMS